MIDLSSYNSVYYSIEEVVSNYQDIYSKKSFLDEDEEKSFQNQNFSSYNINTDNNMIENSLYTNIDFPLPLLGSTQNTEIISGNEKPKTEIMKPKIKIFEFIKEKKEEKNILKQKRKRNENSKGKVHTKYDSDNIARKIKTKLFDGIIKILNNSLLRKGKIFHIAKTKNNNSIHFVKINQDFLSQTSVQSTLDLLNSTLRDIFSQKCSVKYKNYPDINRTSIQEISGNTFYERTNEILDMTFFQCLEHFRGSNKYEVLNQLEKEHENALKEFYEKYGDDEYIKKFSECLKKYETIFSGKKPKKSKFSKE
jgi:hypothetical protein